MPLVKRVERRLTCFTNMLSYGGRLQLVNSVMSSLPTFHMSTFLLPQGVITQLDKYRRHCLWRGQALTRKNPPLAAWEIVCRPKDEGGLGVINLELQNKALLIENMHRFFNKANLPWVQLV